MAASADISEPWGTIQMRNTGKFLYADLMDSCGIKSMQYHRGVFTQQCYVKIDHQKWCTVITAV